MAMHLLTSIGGDSLQPTTTISYNLAWTFGHSSSNWQFDQFMTTMTSYLPTANTSEIRGRFYQGAVRLYSWTGITNGQQLSNRRRRTLPLKIVVLGDSGAGKTSLIARYLNNHDIELHPKHTQYGEYYTRRLVLGDRNVAVQVWDIPTHVLDSDINDECFLQRSHGAIIVYDVTSRSSFESVEGYLRKIRRYGHPGVMCILLGNKRDLQPPSASPSSANSLDVDTEQASMNSSNSLNNKWVSTAEGRQFADGYSMGFVEASAFTGNNVQDAFNNLLSALNEAANNAKPGFMSSGGSAVSNN